MKKQGGVALGLDVWPANGCPLFSLTISPEIVVCRLQKSHRFPVIPYCFSLIVKIVRRLTLQLQLRASHLYAVKTFLLTRFFHFLMFREEQ